MPKELSKSRKGLTDIQSNDNKCFLWCHVRYLSCEGIYLWRISRKYLWRISRKDKEISKNLNYDHIKFPVSKKDYRNISVMNKINVNVFCYVNYLSRLFV